MSRKTPSNFEREYRAESYGVSERGASSFGLCEKSFFERTCVSKIYLKGCENFYLPAPNIQRPGDLSVAILSGF